MTKQHFLRSVPATPTWVVALALLVSATVSHAAPLEAYGQLPSMEDLSISPDGTRIAFVKAAEGDRFVAVRSIADAKPLGLLRVGTSKLRSLAWADDNRLMIVTSVTGVPEGLIGDDAEWAQLQVYDIAKKKSIPVPDGLKLTGMAVKKVEVQGASAGSSQATKAAKTLALMASRCNPINAISGRVVVRNIDSHTVLFFQTYCAIGRVLPVLMRADLDKEEEILLEMDFDRSMVGWSVDAAGTLAAVQHYFEKSRSWSVRAHGVRELAGGKASLDYPRLLGLGRAPETLLMAMGENGESVWKPMSLKDGTYGSSLADGKSLITPIDDRLTGSLIGALESGDDSRYKFFDDKMQTHWNAIVEAFKDNRVTLVSASDDLMKLVVLVDGPKFGYQYQLVDLTTHRADRIGYVYDAITEPQEVRRVDYPAVDGLTIPAYLTLPRGRAARHLPLVVLVHGGPAAQDTRDFDWFSQALADQGYAVLRPNYRGSTVDVRLMQAGFGQFGRKMQTDLSDGVGYLSKEGIADPARVCVVGASYGGYAALAGATLDPGVYRCAVSIAGVSDLKAFLKWVNEKHDERTSIEQRYWDRFMGVSGPKDPLLTEISPIKHVDAVRAPILLIHGKDDTVVPYDQSDDMYDALRDAKKDVEFVKLKHEDHWLSRSETRLQMLQATVTFLRRHNPPD